MTWLIARQYRTELIFTLPLMAGLLALFFFTGRSITGAFQEQGLSTCLGAASPEPTCMRAAEDVLNQYGWLTTTMPFINFVPALIGVIAAAPLVLEFDQRTYRLAWTQGIGRTRWFVTKLAASLVLAGVSAAVLALVITRMYHPINLAESRWNESFNFAAPVFISYSLFATALVISVGVLAKKALAAFVASFIAFFVVRIALENFARPHFLAPKVLLSQGFDLANRKSWILSQRPVDANGHTIDRLQCFRTDPLPCPLPADLLTKTVFHPDSRFWLFQGIESGIFLGATVLMLGVSTWWLSKRVA
ncbi:MAG: hypothetical protein ABI577_14660 [bacterium]